jgi:hypothetical protein
VLKVLHALAVLALVLVASACRVDLVVAVTMGEDGSGTVSVAATADSEVVERAPGLAQDLRFDDVEKAGWEVTGPTVTDAGGLVVQLTHRFATPAEATALLTSLNGPDGPFQGVQFLRTEDDAAITYTLRGVGRVNSGIAVFTDPDLLGAVGATPYVDEIAAAGLSPTEAVGITFSVDLPGAVDESSVDPEAEAEGLTWAIPLDGASVDLSATSTLSLADDAVWSAVATVFLVALIVWLVAAAALIGLVVRARRRRLRRARPVAPHDRDPRPRLERSDSPR